MAMQLHMLAFCLIILLSFHHVSSCGQEDYWRMKLPNVPMPQAIVDSLQHSSVGIGKDGDVIEPSTIDSKKKMTSRTDQPYTVFAWKYDEAGNPIKKVENSVVEPSNKKMTSRTDQPYTVFAWKYDEAGNPIKKVGNSVVEPSNKKMTSRTDQPYTVFAWKYDEAGNPIEKVGNSVVEPSNKKMTSRTHQPYTVFSWKYDEAGNPIEKVGNLVVEPSNKKMTSRTNQPYTVFSWKYDEAGNPIEKVGNSVVEPSNKKMTSRTNQPYTVFSWKYDEAGNPIEKVGNSVVEPSNKKMTSRTNQPYTVFAWKYDEAGNPINKVGNSVVEPSNKKMTSRTNQPYTVFAWKYDEAGNPIEKVGNSVVEPSNKKMTSRTNQPYTVFAWKYEVDKSKTKNENVEDASHHHHLMHNNVNSDQEDGGSVFFIEKSLQLGMKLKHDFQKTPKVPFLPKHTVQAIPFQVEKFAEILNLFSLDSESVEATAIKETLGVCLQRPKVKKENRTCAQSIEDVVDFVIGELGTNDIKLRMMNNNIEVPKGIQDYVLTKVKKLEVPGNNAVACHRMSYPYVVYYCHHQQDIGHYDVTLVDPTSGSAVQTTAVCHYDTYAWQPNVPALRYLKIRPGDAPVCHFSAINDMFWSLKSDSNKKSLDMIQ